MIKYKKAFINGLIHTVNPQQPTAEAVITVLNKILFVGSNEEAKRIVDSDTEVYDLKGKLMLPGFTDGHVHTIMGGKFLQSVDLSKAGSTDEFKILLRDYISNNRKKWVTEGNWNHQNWEKNDLPRKEWIDDFSVDTPVFVSRMDYHMALANTKALELAGVTKDTQDPPGGEIVRDPETGEPTGILKDKAMDFVFDVIPVPSDKELETAIDAAMDHAKKFGVTSIHDITYKNHFRALQNADYKNKLTARIYSRLPIDNCEGLIKNEIIHAFGNDKLKIGSMKAFADGSLGSSTAWFFNTYSDNPESCGLPMDIMTDGRFEKWAIECDKNKLQLSVHAIGDRAISEVLDVFEKIVKVNPEWDRRFRIEHAQHMAAKDFERCRKLGVIVSAQPYHLFDDGGWAVNKIGMDRMSRTLAFKSFMDAGVRMTFGSDWSVAPLNPMTGIYAALTRKTIDGGYPDGLVPEEKISLEEAIECYTINGAYAAFEEKRLGSIEPGKLADLVVLTDNLFEISADKIKNVQAEMTIFDGEIIYSIH